MCGKTLLFLHSRILSSVLPVKHRTHHNTITINNSKESVGGFGSSVISMLLITVLCILFIQPRWQSIIAFPDFDQDREMDESELAANQLG